MKLEYSHRPYTDNLFPHRVKYWGSEGSLISAGSGNIDKWCEDTFGENSFITSGVTWNFKTKEDAMLFILRWA
jgi:hypothetical protein